MTRNKREVEAVSEAVDKKIYTRIVIDMHTGETLEEEYFLYSGPLALCEGDDGPAGDGPDNPPPDDGGGDNPPPDDGGEPPIDPTDPTFKPKHKSWKETEAARKELESRLGQQGTRIDILERQIREAANHPPLNTLPNQPNNQPPVDINQPLPKPNVEDFGGDYAKYETARDEWLLKEGERRGRVQALRDRDQSSFVTKQQTFQQKVSEAAKTDDDVAMAIRDSTFVQSEAVGRLMMDSDNPAALVKYLYGNRDVLDRINRLNPVAAAREIGRIEAAINTPTPVPPVKKVSNAPPPVKPINGGQPITVTDEDELSTGDWMAKERERQSKRVR